MQINVLTLFPSMLTPMRESIIGRALDNGIVDMNIIDIRDFSTDKRKAADDYPFGGGAGLVMSCQPIWDAMSSVGQGGKKILMSPRGRLLNKEYIDSLLSETEITILCGHYEGIDERVIEHFQFEEVSIGDVILTGGEIPAMVLMDSLIRLIPDVLSSRESAEDESLYSGLVEYPQYTKPRNFRDHMVPEVLLSGDHRKIYLWRLEESIRRTYKVRRDLFDAYMKKYELRLNEKPRPLKDERMMMERLLKELKLGDCHDRTKE